MEIILEANTEKPEKVFFIDNPRVWNGKKDPYLYTAKMIMEGSGDEVSTRFGIREFYVDAETGFFLNQESYPSRRVSQASVIAVAGRKGVGTRKRRVITPSASKIPLVAVEPESMPIEYVTATPYSISIKAATRVLSCPTSEVE